MTVKCLPDHDKSEIAQLYAAKLCDSDTLAKSYGVSRRTINRVVVEQGVNRIRVCKPRVQPPVYVDSSAPAELPITMIEPEPFLKRLLQSIKSALSFSSK